MALKGRSLQNGSGEQLMHQGLDQRGERRENARAAESGDAVHAADKACSPEGPVPPRSLFLVAGAIASPNPIVYFRLSSRADTERAISPCGPSTHRESQP